MYINVRETEAAMCGQTALTINDGEIKYEQLVEICDIYRVHKTNTTYLKTQHIFASKHK